MKKPQGLVLYRGPSQIDDEPIVAVATGLARRSKNPKTGRVIQTYILVAGKKPHEARQDGSDRSICGDCPHRCGTCYVNLVQGPLAVYGAWMAHKYPKYQRRRHLRYFRDRIVRLGTYGDPAAVPLEVWDDICGVAAGWRGYTHQWEDCDPGFARLCMASVETLERKAAAQALGYRTFRVLTPDGEFAGDEFQCPASAEEGRRLTCEGCKACGGATHSPRAHSPAIRFHGPRIADNWQLRRFLDMMGRLEDAPFEERHTNSRRFNLL